MYVRVCMYLNYITLLPSSPPRYIHSFLFCQLNSNSVWVNCKSCNRVSVTQRSTNQEITLAAASIAKSQDVSVCFS